MNGANKRVLVLGYGNPGRQDDGLGPAAAEALERLYLPGVDIEINYLLNIEDAADAVAHDRVVFVDAAATGPEPFAVRDLVPAEEMAFTSHIVKPEVILAICQKCYGRVPQASLIAIRGYEFELREELSQGARTNLEQAVAYLRCLLTEEQPT